MRKRRIEYEPDQQNVSRASKDRDTLVPEVWPLQELTTLAVPNTKESSELRRTAKWHEPPEEIEEEDDLLTGDELKVLQTLVLAMDRRNISTNFVKELM